MAVDASLFHNCLSVQDGYPHRFAAKQLAFYRSMGPDFTARAECTAGIRLAFRTKAQKLQFEFQAPAFCRSRNVVDVYEDGQLVDSVRLADMQTHGVFCYERASAKEARLDLWLPNTCGLQILDVDFGDYAPVAPGKHKRLLLGDSIFQGICSYSPSCSIGNQWMLGEEVEAVNQSVGGARFFPEVLETLSFTPDEIIVALGINDVYAADDNYAKTIPDYFAKLRALWPSAPCLAITPIRTMRLLTDTVLQKKYRAVRETILDACSANGIETVIGDQLVPCLSRFFNEDGVHPNDLGFMVYALNLSKQLHASSSFCLKEQR